MAQLRDGARVPRRVGVRRRVPLGLLLLTLSAVGCAPASSTATGSPSEARSGETGEPSPAPTSDPEAPARNGPIAFSRVVGDAGHGDVMHAELVVRYADGRERMLTDTSGFRSAPAFSPDGTSIAYVGDGGLSVADLADPAGGTDRLAPCRPPACLGFGPPAWSPDGQTIALGMLGDATAGVALVDVDDPAPTVLARNLADGAPAWSPDGRELAFVSSDRLLVVDASNGDVLTSTRFPGRLTGDVAWSPDGATFALDGTVDGETGIFLLPASGGAPTLLTACPDDGCTDLDPAWSPDGASVVFTRARCDLPGGDCYTGDILVVDAAGGDAEPVVTGPPLDCCAAWGQEP